MLLESLDEFGARHLTESRLRQLDEDSEFPEDLVRSLLGGDLGLNLLFVQEEDGGLDAPALQVCRVCEKLAGIDLGVATSVLATALGLDPIRVGGTPVQKHRWMGRAAEHGWVVAYGVTEPGAGSDVGSIKTRAVPVVFQGKVRGYRLEGTKCFITNGRSADLYTILARAPEGPSFFVVEKKEKGLLPGRKEDKHGIRASETAEVILDGVEVPLDHLIGGKEGLGLAQAAQVFGHTRLMVAAFGVGAGAQALRKAIEHARNRVQAGSPLISKPGVTHKLLLPHIVRINAGRAYVQEVAQRLDRGEPDLAVEASLAKLFTTNAGCDAADSALQVFGGYGFTREYPVERIRRDVRITTIYEGTSEIQQEVAGRGRWRQLLMGKGVLYLDLAREMVRQEAACPGTGGRAVALAAKALVAMVEHARKARLGRRQSVIFRLARMAAEVETAAALARLACRSMDSGAASVVDLAAMARLHAGDAAAAVALGAASVLSGTRTLSMTEARTPGQDLDPAVLLDCLAGQEQDLDLLAGRLEEDDLVGAP